MREELWLLISQLWRLVLERRRGPCVQLAPSSPEQQRRDLRVIRSFEDLSEKELQLLAGGEEEAQGVRH
jgi:hypothetical protein